MGDCAMGLESGFITVHKLRRLLYSGLSSHNPILCEWCLWSVTCSSSGSDEHNYYSN